MVTNDNVSTKMKKGMANESSKFETVDSELGMNVRLLDNDSTQQMPQIRMRNKLNANSTMRHLRNRTTLVETNSMRDKSSSALMKNQVSPKGFNTKKKI